MIRLYKIVIEKHDDKKEEWNILSCYSIDTSFPEEEELKVLPEFVRDLENNSLHKKDLQAPIYQGNLRCTLHCLYGESQVIDRKYINIMT